MHELVELGHSMTHAVVGLCRDETRTSEHVGISPAEEGWTVANDNEIYLVAALTWNVLQQQVRNLCNLVLQTALNWVTCGRDCETMRAPQKGIWRADDATGLFESAQKVHCRSATSTPTFLVITDLLKQLLSPPFLS
jgi:hypothetical protein